jgi:hypothetical protein
LEVELDIKDILKIALGILLAFVGISACVVCGLFAFTTILTDVFSEAIPTSFYVDDTPPVTRPPALANLNLHNSSILQELSLEVQ